MRQEDFEKAIDALNIHGLSITEMRYGVGGGGHITAVYGKLSELTYLFWDGSGRGFRFDINPKLEGCTVVSKPEYLDYRRDAAFDLKFE